MLLDAVRRQALRVFPKKGTADILLVVVKDLERERGRAGLCADCRYLRLITSDRGATFYLCQRSASDNSFPKYPRLPVIRCRGYEKKEPE